EKPLLRPERQLPRITVDEAVANIKRGVSAIRSPIIKILVWRIVVDGMGQGVGGNESQPAGEPPLDLCLERIVIGFSGSFLHRDTVPALNGTSGVDRAGSQEGLVDVAARQHLCALGTDVTDIDYRIGAERLLDAQAPVLHVPVAEVCRNGRSRDRALR